MADAVHAEAENAIRSIVIVGGGTAGWMAAAALVGRLERQAVDITVVEAPDIRTVGVGEATVPGIRDYFRDLGVTEQEVMRATHGTIKLGIDFVGWRREGHRFFHPFGLYGMASRGVAFHHYWLKLRASEQVGPLADYCLATALAYAERFAPPPVETGNDFNTFNWAVHFDAGRYAAFLRDYAVARGVRHVEGTIVDTALDGSSGNIDAVRLRDGGTISGDLFIDCSGFRGLLIGGALETGYVDWSDLLPCDRAVAIPCAHGADGLTPYTRSTAHRAGWMWRIPLTSRVGNGYVYSSRHISDDEAVASLRATLEGEALAEPNILRFTTGRRERFWHRNCVALGLAAGFMEPLESTSITLIQTGIEKLIGLFPDRRFDPALADEYNRATALEYERIRDFLLLHYVANGRHGEPMWDACRALSLPEPLAHKLRLFRARGRFVRYEWESFLDPSWISIYEGLDVLPAAWDPLADYFTTEQLHGALARIRGRIADQVARATPIRDYLADLHGAPV